MVVKILHVMVRTDRNPCRIRRHAYRLPHSQTHTYTHHGTGTPARRGACGEQCVCVCLREWGVSERGVVKILHVMVRTDRNPCQEEGVRFKNNYFAEM